MKSRKRQMTEGLELPNQEKIRKLREKETCKYLKILEADTIKQVVMKGKRKRNASEEQENDSKLTYIPEISSKR